MKQSRYFSRWKPRYFKLEDGYLTYFEKKALVGTSKNKVGPGCCCLMPRCVARPSGNLGATRRAALRLHCVRKHRLSSKCPRLVSSGRSSRICGHAGAVYAFLESVSCTW